MLAELNAVRSLQGSTMWVFGIDYQCNLNFAVSLEEGASKQTLSGGRGRHLQGAGTKRGSEGSKEVP